MISFLFFLSLPLHPPCRPLLSLQAETDSDGILEAEMSCRFRSRLKFAAEDVVFECLNRASVSILGFFSSFESVVRGCGTSRVVPFKVFDIVVALFSIDVPHEGSLRIVVFDKRPGNDSSYGVVFLVAVFVNQTDYFGAVSQLVALENSFFGNRSVAS